MPRMPPHRPLLLTVLSALLFALMAFAAKLAAARLPGDQIAFLRFAVMLLPLVFVPRLARKAFEFQRLDLLVYRGVFGGLAVLFYFVTIAHIPVGIATLFNYASPIWSVAFAALFLGERIDPRFVVPLLAALAGMVLASTGGAGFADLTDLGPWEITGIASSVLSGAALAAVRAARRTEGAWSIYGSFSLCGLLATAPFALSGFVRPTAAEWLLLLFVGASAVAAQLLMTWAYRWVTNVQAGAISQLTVVGAMLLGVVFLGDRLTPLQIAGSALTLAGVVGTVWLQATPRAVE